MVLFCLISMDIMSLIIKRFMIISSMILFFLSKL